MTKPEPLTPAAETLEDLNEQLSNLDKSLEEVASQRNALSDEIDEIKADRKALMKKIIAAHKEKVKALSSEVRKTRSDAGVPRKKQEAAKP